MDTKKKPIVYRNRFLKLSLKKNRLNTNNGGKESELDSNVIILDESFDCLMYDKVNVHDTQKVCSPIIIDDSIDSVNGRSNCKITLSPVYSIPSSKEPSKCGNISFNGSEDELPPVQLKTNTRPSDVSFWSPAQNIICATPKYQITPSTPRDVANESFNECSMKKIEDSQKKLLNDLYGEVWKTMPSLFKTQKLDYDTNVIKKLDFSDGNDSDKENIKIKHAQNKLLYLTSSDIKRNVESGITNTERKSKKKLYTEKVPNTPEPINDINKKFKREVQTTSKKARTKTVTELVQDLKSECTADSSKNPKKDIDYISHKIGNIGVSNNYLSNVKKLSFMGSLADNVPSWRCNDEALKYKENYKSKREELTRRLYKDFNELVFSNNLDEDMPIIWDTRLRSSAGITINRVVKTSKGIKVCSSTIKLSTKILDGPQRLRDTLIHEMCHAATWIVDKELKAGHGPLWKKWATRALHVIPELGEITRCHDMEIHFKYSYKCTKCGYSINRHSKSIDTTKKCCGYCRGKFELIVNKKTKEGVVVSTPARRGGANEFALYVKENYAAAKGHGRSHAETMKALGEQFSAKKNGNRDS